jgi:hypothetical protein
VDVKTGQVAVNRTPGRARISADLEDLVTGQVDLAWVCSTDGEVHRIETGSVNQRTPGPAPIVTAHHAVVMSEEDHVGFARAESQGVIVQRVQRADSLGCPSGRLRPEKERGQRAQRNQCPDGSQHKGCRAARRRGPGPGTGCGRATWNGSSSHEQTT